MNSLKKPGTRMPDFRPVFSSFKTRTQDQRAEQVKIEIDGRSVRYLNIAGKWAMFLAIAGFIINGLLFVLVLIAGSFLLVFNTGASKLAVPEPVFIAGFFILSLFSFFPLFSLVRFSRFTSKASKSVDPNDLRKAFRNLRLFFVFMGIILIIVLILYVAILISVGSTTSVPKGLI